MPLPDGVSILEELEIEEVSLVDNPANPEAMVTIFKADSGGDELERLRLELLEATKGRLLDKLKDATSFLEVEDAFFSTMQEARKRAGEPPSTEDAMTDLEKAEAARKEAEDKLADLAAKVDELTKAKEEAEAKLADLEKASDPEPEPLPEHIQKAISASEARAKKAEERIQKLEDERSRAEAIQKAKDEYPHAGPSDEMGALMHSIRKHSTEDADKLEEHLRAVSEQVAKGRLFGVVGKDGVIKDRGHASDDPADVADAKARELMKTNDKLTYADALAKVMETEPELYRSTRGHSVVAGKARNA